MFRIRFVLTCVMLTNLVVSASTKYVGGDISVLQSYDDNNVTYYDQNGSKIDDVITRTGFRKTRFAEGKIWLNDRVLMMHGYAQRTSNEWPGVGISVPAWLSDYSNNLIVKSNGNLVRWMHVTPWKQDIESCDRVGLIQAMPAGDAEKDVEGLPGFHGAQGNAERHGH